MRSSLISLLRCPITHETLRFATPEELESINQSLQSGLLNRAKEPVQGPIQQCLIGESSQICYPVRDGLPLLLADESFQI
jgi:uncharacterized protein YbaR (Trm112 family)